MLVLPFSVNPFATQAALHEFLFACKQIAIEKDRPQIVSISYKTVANLDPLVVLETLKQPRQLHFYWEHADYTIAGLDAVAYLKTEGMQRFHMGQEFVASCLTHTIGAGDLDHALAGPHFLCSFSFFEDHLYQIPAFPAATLFLPRWQISCTYPETLLVANCIISPDRPWQPIATQMWREFQTILALQDIPLDVKPVHSGFISQHAVSSPGTFTEAVRSALEAIRTNYLSKIVLSHAIDITVSSSIDWIQAVHNLRCLNPACYIFAIGNGQGQTFIGASPERLLKIQNSEFKTDAMAGSAPRGKTPLEDTAYATYLLQSAKERHEHQVVIDSIRYHLERLGLRSQSVTDQPNLLQLATIQHLRTPIQATVPPDVHIFDILAELHPTPAVAGTPRDIACQEIRRYERYDRGLYAAPLGWLDHQGNGEFIVGIRSALLNGCSARLYAGAGIVAGSDPHQELAEVQLKLQALLRALC
jgi:menaquinone-specific isochorismate synthase